MALARVTLTLDEHVLDEARQLSDGNFSRFVSRLLEDRLATERRDRLRKELRAGYEAEADHDLRIAREYRFIDNEIARREED